MALEDDGASAVLLHLGMTDILGSTADNHIVLQENAVVDNGNGGRYAVRAVSVEYGSVVDDVVNIPFTGLTHSICEGS